MVGIIIIETSVTNVFYYECTGEERDIQKNYWIEHTSELTVEAMMLDSKAADLDKEV